MKSISHWGLFGEAISGPLKPVERLKRAVVGTSPHALVQVLAGDLAAILGLPIEEKLYGVQVVRDVASL